MSQNILKQYKNEGDIEVGLDEAGRGCLFGPVCIAGVIWPDVILTQILLLKIQKNVQKNIVINVLNILKKIIRLFN